MADVFDSAAEEIKRQTRETLAAMARGEVQARDRLATDGGVEQASNRDALAAMHTRGLTYNVPSQVQTDNATTISEPYQRAEQDRGASMRAMQDYLTRTGAAANSYATQAEAGIGVQRTISERERQQRLAQEAAQREAYAEARREREANAQMRALQTEEAQREREAQAQMRAIQLQLAQMGLDEARLKASGVSTADALSDSELRNRLLGAGRIDQQEGIAAASRVPVTTGPGQHAPFSGAGSFIGSAINKMAGVAGQLNRSPEQRARDLGLAAGIDPNRVYGITPEPKTPAAREPAKPKAPTAAEKAQLRRERATVVQQAVASAGLKVRPQAVTNAIDTFEAALTKGRTLDEAVAAIKAGWMKDFNNPYPRLLEQIVALYAPMFGVSPKKPKKPGIPAEAAVAIGSELGARAMG